MRYIILVLIPYFAFFEVVSMLRDGWYYFIDVFNYIDWTSYALIYYLLYVTVFDEDYTST